MTTWPRLDVPDDEERIIRFRPAFHRCHPEPSKNYGIGSVRMHWWLRLGDWAIGWDVNTGWEMPDKEFKAANPDCTHPLHQNGAPTHPVSAGAVDFHSPVPRWEDQSLAQECCPITNAPCYLDSGFLIADDVLTILRTEGDEAVWAWMRSALDEMRSEVASR